MSDQNILKIIPVADMEPNANCVETLEAALERARSGETVGVAIVEQCLNNAGSWSCGGFVGSYSMLGAIQTMQQALVIEQLSEDF